MPLRAKSSPFSSFLLDSLSFLKKREIFAVKGLIFRLFYGIIEKKDINIVDFSTFSFGTSLQSKEDRKEVEWG